MEGQTAATGDAQAAQAPVGQDYGERAQQMDAQGIVPVAGNSHAAGFSKAQGLAPENLPPPGSLPGLGEPSAYPEEPLTAGMPIGPGAGPEGMMMAAPSSPELDKLREVYRRRPNERLRRMIQYGENHG